MPLTEVSLKSRKRFLIWFEVFEAYSLVTY